MRGYKYCLCPVKEATINSKNKYNEDKSNHVGLYSLSIEYIFVLLCIVITLILVISCRWKYQRECIVWSVWIQVEGINLDTARNEGMEREHVVVSNFLWIMDCVTSFAASRAHFQCHNFHKVLSYRVIAAQINSDSQHIWPLKNFQISGNGWSCIQDRSLSFHGTTVLVEVYLWVLVTYNHYVMAYVSDISHQIVCDFKVVMNNLSWQRCSPCSTFHL